MLALTATGRGYISLSADQRTASLDTENDLAVTRSDGESLATMVVPADFRVGSQVVHWVGEYQQEPSRAHQPARGPEPRWALAVALVQGRDRRA